MKRTLAVLVLAVAALTGCKGGGSSSHSCGINKCNVTITTDSQYQVTIFDNVDVTAANISDNSASITIGGDTKTLSPGETATVGGYTVTIAQLDGSSHTVKFTVS